MKQAILHRAESRGHVNHGWLDTYHTFSFAHYYDQDRMGFGALRVLNDDTVAPKMGFGTHPHENMEIVSIPLAGALEHEDSMGNKHVIKKGEIQVMSAGTGVTHSERNRSHEEETKFLQIWVIPRERGVEPRYDQITIDNLMKPNEWVQILSPNKDDQGVWIHQDAYFSLGEFEEGQSANYTMKDPEHGLYVFVLEGSLDVEGEVLSKRDGMGLWNGKSFEMKSLSSSQVLLMEVPLK